MFKRNPIGKCLYNKENPFPLRTILKVEIHSNEVGGGHSTGHPNRTKVAIRHPLNKHKINKEKEQRAGTPVPTHKTK